jgi:hypothetical protein
MSKKPGRNDPCPCGSGLKYKRCCLAKDEAAAREAAAQLQLPDGDDAFDLEYDDEDEEDFVESEQPTEMDDTNVGVDARPTERTSSGIESTVDLAIVEKAHRRQHGICELCDVELTRQGARSHLRKCAPAHDVANTAEQRLVHLRVATPRPSAYWLDVEVKTEAKLEALDAFLRRIWLECCGHLSTFRIGAVEYFSRGYEFDWQPFGGGVFGRRQQVERKMSVRLAEALPAEGESFGYEYDFGSTTGLKLTVIDQRTGRLGRSAVRLLARNIPPSWPCGVCGKPAAYVCPYCGDTVENPFVCAKHRRQHQCDGDQSFLPVVNSPRMGVCGYTADT